MLIWYTWKRKNLHTLLKKWTTDEKHLFEIAEWNVNWILCLIYMHIMLTEIKGFNFLKFLLSFNFFINMWIISYVHLKCLKRILQLKSSAPSFMVCGETSIYVNVDSRIYHINYSKWNILIASLQTTGSNVFIEFWIYVAFQIYDNNKWL